MPQQPSTTIYSTVDDVRCATRNGRPNAVELSGMVLAVEALPVLSTAVT